MTKQTSTKSLTILYTSDVHGNVLPLRYADNQPMELGIAKVAAVIKGIRKAEENVLYLDNGDIIQGTPLTYHHARITPSLPNPMMSILNEMGCEAAVFGNHEFNYGKDILARAVDESHFPWLSANIVRAGTDHPFFGQPYVVKQYPGGLRVAVLGVTTQYIPNWENPSHIEGMAFLDVVETCKKWVPLIRDKESVHLMVVAYHGGFERDVTTGEPTEAFTGENQGYRLCEEVTGIDVLLTGHQHRLISGAEVAGVTVIQPGTQGQHVGRVQVEFEASGSTWTILSKQSDILPVDGVKPDDSVIQLIAPYEQEAQRWLDQPIGQIEGDMLVHNPLAIRLKDNPLIEFFNRVQMSVAGVNISNTALFDNACPGLHPHVTMRDVVANYIYPNTLRVLRLKGQDIKDALERTAAYFEQYHGAAIEVSRDFTTPKPQHYNYDMWEGIEYVINISRPLGQRVVRLTQRGKPLDMDGDYDVVMNNYRAAGGGEYAMFKDRPVVQDIPTEVPELIVNYIMEHKVIPATVDNNWEVVHD